MSTDTGGTRPDAADALAPFDDHTLEYYRRGIRQLKATPDASRDNVTTEPESFESERDAFDIGCSCGRTFADLDVALEHLQEVVDERRLVRATNHDTPLEFDADDSATMFDGAVTLAPSLAFELDSGYQVAPNVWGRVLEGIEFVRSAGDHLDPLPRGYEFDSWGPADDEGYLDLSHPDQPGGHWYSPRHLEIAARTLVAGSEYGPNEFEAVALPNDLLTILHGEVGIVISPDTAVAKDEIELPQ